MFFKRNNVVMKDRWKVMKAVRTDRWKVMEVVRKDRWKVMKWLGRIDGK